MGFQPAEAIVVGAGIIGSSIAWRLAQGGLRVELRDAGKLGGQTSGVGAGMLAPGGEIASPSPFASLLLESHRLYPAFVAELSESTGVAIDFVKCGALETAAGESQWDALVARARVQAALGVVSEPCGSDALFYPDDAIVEPRGMLSALRAACLAAGVSIVEGALVHNLEQLRADVVVLAAGAWSGLIEGLPPSAPQSYPVKGHLIGYDLMPGILGPIRRSGATYLLQRSSGFTVAGSSTEHLGFDTRVDPVIVQEIRSRAEVLYPALKGTEPTVAWTGLRPAVHSAGPAIGRVPGTRYWLAYGHYRNGILAAPATAHRIAAGIISNSETALHGPPNTR